MCSLWAPPSWIFTDRRECKPPRMSDRDWDRGTFMEVIVILFGRRELLREIRTWVQLSIRRMSLGQDSSSSNKRCTACHFVAPKGFNYEEIGLPQPKRFYNCKTIYAVYAIICECCPKPRPPPVPGCAQAPMICTCASSKRQNNNGRVFPPLIMYPLWYQVLHWGTHSCHMGHAAFIKQQASKTVVKLKKVGAAAKSAQAPAGQAGLFSVTECSTLARTAGPLCSCPMLQPILCNDVTDVLHQRCSLLRMCTSASASQRVSMEGSLVRNPKKSKPPLLDGVQGSSPFTPPPPLRVPLTPAFSIHAVVQLTPLRILSLPFLTVLSCSRSLPLSPLCVLSLPSLSPAFSIDAAVLSPLPSLFLSLPTYKRKKSGKKRENFMRCRMHALSEALLTSGFTFMTEVLGEGALSGARFLQALATIRYVTLKGFCHGCHGEKFFFQNASVNSAAPAEFCTEIHFSKEQTDFFIFNFEI
ncbi:hypothetical protein XELAEV_18031455mg [Xenopus laevis]|uniref:Uncharacterized protein n=1 Tax=Xenopus laevis TaxID=8355 RepID=A0A974CPA0_XENLA|nr:hypothetical protein XELAEV_18031455mg [Xenopus laevis]